MSAPPPALIAELATRPADRELLRVFADWLLEVGHPSGELMALELAAEPPPNLGARVAALIATQLEPYLEQRLARRHPTEYAWRAGLLDAIALHHEGAAAPLAQTLRELAAEPCARLLRRIEIRANELDGEGNLEPVIAELARLAPAFPRLTELAVREDREPYRWVDTGVMPIQIGDVSPLYASYPRLELLELAGKEYTLGALELPALRRLALHEFGPRDIASLAVAPLPVLEDLELAFTYGVTIDRIDDVFRPLLDRTLPTLGRLAIVVQLRQLMQFLVRAVPASNLARHARVLAFRRCILDDDSVRALVQWAPRLRALARLEIEGTGLSTHHRRALEQALGPVLAVSGGGPPGAPSPGGRR